MSDELRHGFYSLLITHHSLLLFLRRVTRVDPGVVAAEQGGRVFKTFSLDELYRTGTAVFGRSRAVGDNHLIGRQFLDPRHDVVDWNPERAFRVPRLV